MKSVYCFYIFVYLFLLSCGANGGLVEGFLEKIHDTAHKAHDDIHKIFHSKEESKQEPTIIVINMGNKNDYDGSFVFSNIPNAAPTPAVVPSPSPVFVPIVPTPSSVFVPTVPTPSPVFIPTVPTPSPVFIPTVPTPSPVLVPTVPTPSLVYTPAIPTLSDAFTPTNTSGESAPIAVPTNSTVYNDTKPDINLRTDVTPDEDSGRLLFVSFPGTAQATTSTTTAKDGPVSFTVGCSTGYKRTPDGRCKPIF